MSTFLNLVAKDFVENYESKKDDTLLIFPNKRSIWYFRKEYAKIIGNHSFSPFCKTIDEVIKNYTQYSFCADQLVLIVELFECFKEVFDYPESLNAFYASDFSNFFDTGATLLNDFNEIDLYHVNTKQLFTNSKDIAQLEEFYADNFTLEQIEAIKKFYRNFNIENLSKEKRRYKELWEGIPKVYHSFRERLSKKHIGYRGMIYRNICENIENNSIRVNNKKQDKSQYLFVGFNALNVCEKKIFKFFENSKNAKFYWDLDAYYILDEVQEAGYYMRENLKLFPNKLKDLPNNIVGQEKNIEIIASPLDIGQSKIIYNILDEMPIKQDEQTAIVLANENLLFPILHSIPPKIETINVTMGYPFVQTICYSFLNNCLNLRNNLIVSKSGESVFFYKELIAFLKHPLIYELENKEAKQTLEEISKSPNHRVSISEFVDEKRPLLNQIFDFVAFNEQISYQNYQGENPSLVFLDKFLNIISEIFFAKNPSSKQVEQDVVNEYLYSAFEKIKSLKKSLSNFNSYNFDINLTIKLLKDMFREIKVNFDVDLDKNTEGLQIIGMMETRNIDFDNLIIVGMNEDVFPTPASRISFITEGMRFAFSLPVVKLRDASMSYFFYRLLQRSKNVKIIYNNVCNNSKSGEPSRFLMQIIKEAPLKENCKINFTNTTILRNIQPTIDLEIDPNKSEATQEILKNYFLGKKSFSHSSLQTYRDCPLKFYLSYIAGIKQENELEEDFSANEFGTILHDTLQFFYTDCLDGKNIDVASVDKNLPLLDQYIEKAIRICRNIAKNKEIDLSGNNIVALKTIKEHAENIINFDKTLMPFQIISMENKDEGFATIPVKYGEKYVNVNLNSRFDRVDKVDGITRILDYKTGSVDFDFELKEDDIKGDKISKVPFQGLMYCYIYSQNNPIVPIPVVYSVRQISSKKENDVYFKAKEDKTTFVLDSNNIEYVLRKYQEKLSALIEEIISPETKFEKTTDARKCEYCPFKGNICDR